MKKFYFFAIVCLCSLTNWAGNILDLSTGQFCDNLSTKPLCNKEDFGDSIIITYDFQAAQIVNDEIFTGCIHWKYEDWGINHNQGEASFPIKYDTYTTTQNQNISIALIESDYIDFNYELAPAHPISTNNLSSSQRDIAPINLYSGFYPNKLVEFDDVQTQKNNSTHWIKISPVQYDHSNKIVRAYTKIKFKVEFTSKSRAHDIIITPNPVEQDTISQDYIIISSNKYSSAVYNFAKWKRDLGFNVKIALDDNWTSEKIKNKIQSLYNSSNECYALIIGDHIDVPAISSTFRPTDTVEPFHFTDLYYGCLDGSDDYFSDIYIGRLPVSTLAEANVVINKIINYEKNPPINAPFYNSGMICSEFFDNNYNSTEDDPLITTSESIRNHLMSLGKSVDRIYSIYNNNINPLRFYNGDALPSDLLKPTFSWAGSSTNIINSINAGRFFALHYGHGYYYSWSTPDFYVNHINSLTNNNLLPVVFSINCLTGAYNYSNGDCIAEAFLKKLNGGCVGIFAPTNNNYIYYSKAITSSIFNNIWPQSENINSVCRLGEILNNSLIAMCTSPETPNNIRKYHSEIFHCFGDPSMMIRTENPTTISNVFVNRNAEVEGAVRVSISGLGDNNHYIAFHDTRIGKTFLVKGSSALYRTNDPNYVNICVYNQNKIPYINLGQGLDIIQTSNIIEPSDFISTIGPNPTNGQITIECSISESASSANIVVSDLYGNTKSTMPCSAEDNVITMNLSNLNNGIYVATLIVDNVTKDTKRIIVQK